MVRPEGVAQGCPVGDIGKTQGADREVSHL
jgi:hypothetical protein